ncbi:hypothetical protein H4R18_000953 [Coemansia javaensis]|uniref:DUF4097 domain-containing protein n=1 Tax=Coemansia javaensis TaxID=2761396 RepID=A0A9W8HF89_9FUNG|nr:hypothetical protein H4R18_000953 [Coemansia javaensis]
MDKDGGFGPGGGAEAEPADLPPPYTAVAGGDAALDEAPGGGVSELDVVQLESGEVQYSWRLPADRPVLVRTNGIAGSSLVVEQDAGGGGGGGGGSDGGVVVRAEFSGGFRDVRSRCGATVELNAGGEYEVHAYGTRSLWNVFALRCTITVRLPPAAGAPHPGVRATLNNGQVRVGGATGSAGSLQIDAVDVQAVNTSVSLARATVGRVAVRTTNAVVDVANVAARGPVDLETHNGDITLHEVHVGPGGDAGSVDARTDNARIECRAVSASGAVRLATKNARIECSAVHAGALLQLATNNGRVVCHGVDAAEMRATSKNARIECRDLRVSSALHVTTSNSAIKCRDVRADEAFLTTTNAGIQSDTMDVDALRLSTTNSAVEGTWRVRDLLDIRTTNSRIQGEIDLKDRAAPANISLATDNAQIRVSLPAGAFRGRFDLETTSAKATIDGDPAVKLLTACASSARSHKFGTVGDEGDELRHNLRARTTHSAITVKLCGSPIV